MKTLVHLAFGFHRPWGRNYNHICSVNAVLNCRRFCQQGANGIRNIKCNVIPKKTSKEKFLNPRALIELGTTHSHSTSMSFSTNIKGISADRHRLQTDIHLRNYSTINSYRLDIDDSVGVLPKKLNLQKDKGLPIIHHHGYVSDLPPKHRFAMRKFHGVMKFLRKDGIISMKQVSTPDLLTEEVACLAHDPDYVHRFFNGLTSEKEQRRTGFVWDEGLVRRCRLEAAGTVLGAEIALQKGLACSTGGGTHHAHVSFGSGFCLLNDLAITARYLNDRNLTERVLIVDLDVHQGDGTASILSGDENIFTFSVHCQSNFPFTKQTSDLDLGLPDHMNDQTYMKELHRHLPALLESFRPDIVLYDAGVDPHISDDLGKFDLTDQGLFTRDSYVFEECLRRGVPCVSVIGGGYSRDIHELSLRHTIVHRAASKLWSAKCL